MAVEADAAGKCQTALEQYQMALEVFAACGDENETMEALGALMGGSKEDARSLIIRSEQRAEELQAAQIDHTVEELVVQIDDESAESGSSLSQHLDEDSWDECSTPAPSVTMYFAPLVEPTTPAPVSLDSDEDCTPVSQITTSPTGNTKIQTRNSVRNLLDEGITNIPRPKLHLPNEMNKHLVIKDLDTGAITHFNDADLAMYCDVLNNEQNASKQNSHEKQEAEVDTPGAANAALIKRMVRNLDTGAVSLLKEDKPTQKGRFMGFSIW